MSAPPLQQILDSLIAGWEGECVEFKEANDNFSSSDIGVSNRTPTRYRNRALAQAMVHLRMIDTMGFGIRDVMFKGQARRFFPLPDFDLTDPAHVVLRIQGRFIGENYCDLILEYLRKFGQGTRADFRRLILDKLSDVLNPKQKDKKLNNLLQKLRRETKITSVGKTSAGTWELPKPAKDPDF